MLRRWILPAFLLGTLAAGHAAAPGDTVAGPLLSAPQPARPQGKDPTADLFNHLIPRIEIALDPSAVEALRHSPRTYVRATLREGTNVLTDVAVKLKGARGSFRPVDNRPALTINTDKFRSGQEFHGLDKFHLNNSVQDPTLMNEIICGELFRAAGVPTARATHARLIFDGRDLGFYVLKEGYERKFLKRHFADNNGNLYDGGFLQDVDDHLEKDSGDGPNDWSDLAELVAAVQVSGDPERKAQLEQVLDIEKFITFVAIEMLTCHWDGYTQNRNNYRLYRDPTTDKFVFIPHGMDQMFWDVNYPITPGVNQDSRRGRRGFRRNGMVALKTFEVVDYQKRYLERIGELLDKEFSAEWLGLQVTRIEIRVREQVGRTDPQFASYMSAYSRNVRRQLIERVRSARAQHTALMRRYRLE
jgi:spore coat protein CotH